MNNCDYYRAIDKRERINCTNCTYRDGIKCSIGNKVARNDKTDLVHEQVKLNSRVTAVLK